MTGDQQASCTVESRYYALMNTSLRACRCDWASVCPDAPDKAGWCKAALFFLFFALSGSLKQFLNQYLPAYDCGGARTVTAGSRRLQRQLTWC